MRRADVTDQEPEECPPDHALEAPETAFDEIELDEPEQPSRTFDGWRRRSAIGGLATGIALGLQEVFQPNKNEPVLATEAPGDPPDDERGFRVILDPDDPTKSRVVLTNPTPPDQAG